MVRRQPCQHLLEVECPPGCASGIQADAGIAHIPDGRRRHDDERLRDHHQSGLGSERRPRPSARGFGLLCALGGVIALVGAAWLTAIHPRVSSSRISYPLGVHTFQASEIVWTVTHVLTFFGALGLARTGWAGAGRLARIGTPLMVTGMALLIPAELAFVFVATRAANSTAAEAVSSAIGVVATLAGVGFLLVGVAVVRAHHSSGWVRWMPLGVGVYEVIVLTAVAPLDGRVFTAGIAGWNVCLAALGVGLAAASDRPES